MCKEIVEIQKCLLDLLIEFQRICKKYNLNYFAIGGTCLGAIRHKGFIPWDDDIDIAMPYEDYCKFRKLAAKELSEPYAFFDSKEVQFCTFNYIKIHNRKTTFIEEDSLDYIERYTGVFIDIMPIYGTINLPDKILSIYLNCMLRLNRVIRFPYKSEKTFGGKLLWLSMWLFKKKMPFYYFSEILDEKLGKFPMNNGKKIMFGWRQTPLVKPKGYTYHTLFPTNIFLEYEEVSFENIIIRVPAKWNEYLNMDFGDYMTLPPLEQRFSPHKNSIVNLNVSYVDYIKGLELC